MSGEVATALAALLALAQGASDKPAKRLTDGQQLAYAQRLAQAVRRKLPQLSRGAQQLVAALGLFESGWGQSWAAQYASNPFNTTWHPSFTSRPHVRQENADWGPYDSQGRRSRIAQEWLVYVDLDSSVAGFWWFLGPTVNGGRYVPARDAIEGGGLLAAAERLRSGGYYTEKLDVYASGLAGALARLEREVQW